MPEHILSLSYGKDSLACLGATEQLGWPLDRIEWRCPVENAPLLGKTKSVKCIETQKIYESTKQAERETGICHSHISKCCSGKLKTAGGVRWEYA